LVHSSIMRCNSSLLWAPMPRLPLSDAIQVAVRLGFASNTRIVSPHDSLRGLSSERNPRAETSCLVLTHNRVHENV
jgi:hypothetical protein